MELLRHDSTSTRWPGYVLTRHYLNFPTLAKWEKVGNHLGADDKQSLQNMVDYVLPFMCEFVMEWHIDGLPEAMTVDDLPGDPAMLSWLIDIVNKVFEKTTAIEPDLPKESSSTSDMISPPPES